MHFGCFCFKGKKKGAHTKGHTRLEYFSSFYLKTKTDPLIGTLWYKKPKKMDNLQDSSKTYCRSSLSESFKDIGYLVVGSCIPGKELSGFF
jgi:hypothetical protein